MPVERDFEPVYVTEGEIIRIADGHGKEPAYVVGSDCGGNDGHWYCVICNEGAPHNLAIMAHAEKLHRLVWICHLHGPETVRPKEEERPA